MATTTNYRQNLKNYWKQFFPDWDIPNGYHVHHILPRSLGGTHDPSNLIALHPDDHVSIHRCRGDKVTENFIRIAGCLKGKPKTAEHINKVATALRGRKLSEEHIANMKKSLKGRKVWNTGIPMSAKTKQKISKIKKGKVAHNKGDTGRKHYKGDTGRKHYNNGLIGIMVFLGEEPAGFVLGRLYKNGSRGNK